MTIKLVSETPEEQVAALRAREAADRAEIAARSMVDFRLRDLAANLIRIARGAGRPYEIEEQATRFLQACLEYRDEVGHGVPSDAVHDMLRVRRYPPRDREWTDRQNAWSSGEEAMIASALQMAASRLLGQGLQEARGNSEMFDGSMTIERLREENQPQWAAEKPRGATGRTSKVPNQEW